MPQKSKSYENVIFKPEVIRAAYERFVGRLPRFKKKLTYFSYEVSNDGESWTFETLDAFFSAHRQDFASAKLGMYHYGASFSLRVRNDSFRIETSITISLKKSSDVDHVFEAFERECEKSLVSPELEERLDRTTLMSKSKEYEGIIFRPDVIREAYDRFRPIAGESEQSLYSRLEIKRGAEKWEYATDDEFFSEYREPFSYATYTKRRIGESRLDITAWWPNTTVTVELPERAQIESVFEIFEGAAESCKVPKEEVKKENWRSAKIFIGHGRNQQWRDLKDHLGDKHGLQVVCYEVGARAGLFIHPILSEMLTKSSMAFLVMTAEDIDAQGRFHARENVIHELGLFQGRLGFERAIILLEEGTEEFSNIQGLQQIRFSKGNIREAFGDVLATIRREFEEEPC